MFVLNGLVYVAAGLVNRHIWRDLVPSWGHLRTLGRSLLDHMRLRFHHSREYNILQKVTYLAMIAVVFPGIVLTGMTMSPGLNAALPWLVEVFGGRQTARTLHFVFAAAIVLFIVVHLVMVVISGPLNNVRSIVTGRYRIDPEGGRHA